MAELTQEQKDSLAVFAGGILQRPLPEAIPHWLFPTGEAGIVLLIPCADWNPLKAEHGDLVLRALAKNKAKGHEMTETIAWIAVFSVLVSKAYNALCHEPFDFWSTVCNATLEIIKQEGVE